MTSSLVGSEMCIRDRQSGLRIAVLRGWYGRCKRHQLSHSASNLAPATAPDQPLVAANAQSPPHNCRGLVIRHV
eukprot:8489159-Prorocentrum_lima.AAC.1